MDVIFNIGLLLLLVATISLQGFNLRKKDVSKDEKPFGNYRRRTKYKVNVCLQDVFCF